MLSINLIKKYKQEILSISKWFFDYACDHYSTSDIYDYLDGEFSSVQYRSYDYGRSDGLCVNVKTSIGFYNRPKNTLEDEILTNIIDRRYNHSSHYYQMEFDSIKEEFPNLSIKCLGRSGGYWAISNLTFRDVFEFTNDWSAIKVFLQRILNSDFDDSETFLEHVTDALEFSHNYTSDPCIADLVSYGIIKVQDSFKDDVNNFVASCKGIVDYYEDGGKLLEDFYEEMQDDNCIDYVGVDVVLKYLRNDIFHVSMESALLSEANVVCEGVFSTDNLLTDAKWLFTNNSKYPESLPPKLIKYLDTLFIDLANFKFDELTNLKSVA